MRVFLDSSVLLSACGSGKSLSRLVTELAGERGWNLFSSAYCRAEACKNIGKFATGATARWAAMQPQIEWVPNALTIHKPLLLTASKDKPVLITALAARSEVLLTLDKADFGIRLGTVVYGMLVTTPRDFLIQAGLG